MSKDSGGGHQYGAGGSWGGRCELVRLAGGALRALLCLRGGRLGKLLGKARRNFLTLQNFSSFLLLPLLPPPLRQQEITRLELILQEKTRQKEELQQSNAELERKERLMKLQVGGAR